MTREEAVSCVAAINSGLDDLYKLVQRLHDGRGWESLGYDSWSACVNGEFPFSRQRAHQLLQHAQVQQNLSTIVDTFPANEAQSRPLAPLPPEQQREAWTAAVEASDGKPTAADVKEAVAKVTGRPAPTRVVRDADAQETPDYEVGEDAPVSPDAPPAADADPDQELSDAEQLRRMKRMWRKTELSSFWAVYSSENKRALLAWIEQGA